jgi:hypothetical protein
MDLVNATHRRQKSTSIHSQSLNESSNNTTHDNQRQIKSSTQSSTHSRRKLKRHLSKSSKVVPFNVSRNSIQFNSSSQTTV